MARLPRISLKKVCKCFYKRKNDDVTKISPDFAGVGPTIAASPEEGSQNGLALSPEPMPEKAQVQPNLFAALVGAGEQVAGAADVLQEPSRPPLLPKSDLQLDIGASKLEEPAEPVSSAEKLAPQNQGAAPAAKVSANPSNSKADPTPDSWKSVSPGNFLVELRRAAPSDRYGLIWDATQMEKQNIRVVGKVLPRTLAEAWNKSCLPGCDIRPGDELVKVNGKTGRMELMTVELSKMEIFCEFKPSEPRIFRGAEANPEEEQVATAKQPAMAEEQPIKIEQQPDTGSSPSTLEQQAEKRPEKLEEVQKELSKEPEQTQSNQEKQPEQTQCDQERQPEQTQSNEEKQPEQTQDKQPEQTENKQPEALQKEEPEQTQGKSEIIPQKAEQEQPHDPPEPTQQAKPKQEQEPEDKEPKVAKQEQQQDQGKEEDKSQPLPEKPAALTSIATSSPVKVEVDVEEVSDDALPPGHYLIELMRGAAAEKWGFVWDAQVMKKSGERVLDKVTPNSLAADWGRRNNGRGCQKGDKLVKVNRVGGSNELMSKELKQNRVSCQFKSAHPQDEDEIPQAEPISPKRTKVELAPLKPTGAVQRWTASGPPGLDGGKTAKSQPSPSAERKPEVVNADAGDDMALNLEIGF